MANLDHYYSNDAGYYILGLLDVGEGILIIHIDSRSCCKE